MATVPLPEGAPAPLQAALWNEERIEVPVFTWPAASSRMLRVSAQLYNVGAEYDRLAAALRARL